MLKKILKVLLALLVIIAIAGGYLYLRLNNDIENVLEAKDDWRSEVLEFPLIFANDLDYKGEEHIRFAPGWGKVEQEDYFSYVFLWIIEENPDLSSTKLENILNTYFDGLMNTGAITNFNFFKDIPKTKSTIKKGKNDSFEGSIELYDEFFSKKIIKLNAKVKNEYCPRKEKHLVWFYLSPKEKTNAIWDKLNEVKLNFECD